MVAVIMFAGASTVQGQGGIPSAKGGQRSPVASAPPVASVLPGLEDRDIAVLVASSEETTLSSQDGGEDQENRLWDRR